MGQEYEPKTPRGEARVKNWGLHSKRGKIFVNHQTGQTRQLSKRAGSGKRCHLGDGITNVGIKDGELSSRIYNLEKEEQKKK